MFRPFRVGGIVAGLALMGFGVGAVLTGLAGRQEVSDTIKREQIVGTPDMTPSLIARQDEGGRSRCRVADVQRRRQGHHERRRRQVLRRYMRIHALEATGGKTYAQMPQYASANGRGTTTRHRRSRIEDRSAPEQSGAPDLDRRDRTEHRADHVVLRLLGRAVRDRHGRRAAARPASASSSSATGLTGGRECAAGVQPPARVRSRPAPAT